MVRSFSLTTSGLSIPPGASGARRTTLSSHGIMSRSLFARAAKYVVAASFELRLAVFMTHGSLPPVTPPYRGFNAAGQLVRTVNRVVGCPSGSITRNR